MTEFQIGNLKMDENIKEIGAHPAFQVSEDSESSEAHESLSKKFACKSDAPET